VKVLVTAVTVVALTASSVFASARHQNSAPGRAGVEQLGRGSYESYSQGHQSYPNPDRELYVPQRGPYWAEAEPQYASHNARKQQEHPGRIKPVQEVPDQP
jgi:hypothetical protein